MAITVDKNTLFQVEPNKTVFLLSLPYPTEEEIHTQFLMTKKQKEQSSIRTAQSPSIKVLTAVPFGDIRSGMPRRSSVMLLPTSLVRK